MPASASISLASARVTSTRSGGPSPRRVATASSTSTALPTARPSGASMRVSRAVVRTPASVPRPTMVRASSCAAGSSRMNAPLPTLTSSTSAAVPSAIFLDMIELAISGIDSTVPVTSRSAYSLRSAGASPAPAAQITQPSRVQHRDHLGSGKPGPPAGYRLQLVQGAAGVAEAAPGQLRHGGAAARDQRGEDQRDLVADPAGRVLIDGGRAPPNRGQAARRS